MTDISIQIRTDLFDPEVEQAAIRHHCQQSGALVSFVGIMRDFNDDQRIATMQIEHYPEMTERAIRTLAQTAALRWPLEAVRIIHRVGQLNPQTPIVLIAVASAHRKEAFRACEFLIDELKKAVPLWKKERTTTGVEYWVAVRTSKDQATAKN
ncbi:molybdenum cofactor biosynthesis protein MoaE [Rhodoferax sp. 4810]|uniref:Molybdopterin synthase catalytic subunit n=1 Tax=Thiospirillum jenense TaxID=1653858 RepID=A0A839HFK6_9GAMM|nr:molybdenum cofactor biosynthesis protein MoaE [Thiospirillum jenense]MBB1073491.1 molybdenum cofactor biosynthesis protein MoaE [Rhodoferax jenense]MBB1125978.1 molybdenum cofactor biosynthesis protein MoaE [Thiospirillum jenense]